MTIRPLGERSHDLVRASFPVPGEPEAYKKNSRLSTVAGKIIEAKRRGASVILMMGAHLIRAGVQLFLIDLMERGYITSLAMNGAGIIHDYELALIGATTESVARYIRKGEFGLWQETGEINTIVNDAYRTAPHSGLGEAVGRHIHEHHFPHQDISILATAFRLGVPVTIHVGIGYDILHEFPGFDGAATGALSYNDFLIFASIVGRLEGGVIMNFGSAVMAPEVFLKALSMARNVAHQKGQDIRHFTSLVCDLARLPRDITREPAKTSPSYYFRPLKTMLIRTVQDGGESHYVRGSHMETLPSLWAQLRKREAAYGDRH